MMFLHLDLSNPFKGDDVVTFGHDFVGFEVCIAGRGRLEFEL